RRRHLHRGLVGQHFHEILAALDRLARLDQPTDQFGLVDPFAELGQFEIHVRHLIRVWTSRLSYPQSHAPADSHFTPPGKQGEMNRMDLHHTAAGSFAACANGNRTRKIAPCIGWDSISSLAWWCSRMTATKERPRPMPVVFPS